jgi:hypothetical protein
MYRIADAAGRRIADLQQPEPEQANLNCSNSKLRSQCINSSSWLESKKTKNQTN